jgi:hypothetical protein
MIGAVHACIGAALGTLFKRKSTAFTAGLVSHAVADALPHHDYPPKIEVPLMAATMLLIGKLKGFDSPEFWGALGAIAPDAEHGLSAIGVGSFERELFPTHLGNAKLHGPCSDERISQAIVAAASALTLALRKPG